MTPLQCKAGPTLLILAVVCCILLPNNLEAFPNQAGWPIEFSGYIRRSPVVADIDNNGSKEIIFTIGYEFRVYIYKTNGQIYNFAWPKSFSYNVGSAPSVADLDNDGDLEIIVFGRYLYAWHHTGLNVSGFPVDVPDNIAPRTPAVGDLTGDGIPEIAAGNNDCKFYIWDNHGNVLPTFPKTYTGFPACGVNSTVAMGDIDLDGINEVIVPVSNEQMYAYNADGSLVYGIWDFTNPYGHADSDITVGDIDGDNILEALLISVPQTGGWYPVIFNHDTTLADEWPPGFSHNYTKGGLVMGDIDADGKLEVVTGDQDWNDPASVYVWEGETAEIKQGWPITLPDFTNFMRNMILGDVDGDGSVDIIGAAICNVNDGKIYAWDVNANLLSGFPININGFGAFTSTCFIDDIDNDGDVEIGAGLSSEAMAPNDKSRVYIWDLPYTYNADKMPWPQDRHDPAHTNNYHWPDSPIPVPTMKTASIVLVLALLSLFLIRRAGFITKRP